MKTDFLLLLLLTFFCTCVRAQTPVSIELLETADVSEDGLYFTGERGVNYQFGRRISPHGDCIDVVGGYQFLTWYRGGMEDRHLMLSRRRDEVGAPWVHIEFPHRHIGFRGDPTIGDSHNVTVIGVSTADSTIHLIYDLHGYGEATYGDNHFNYSVSLPGTAFLPDAEFNLGVFRAKRTFLRPGGNYERITYPAIQRADDGTLMARYRVGGSGNGDIAYALYRNGEWTSNQVISDGTIPLPQRHNAYGTGGLFMNGKLHTCFQIRYTTSSTLNQTFNLNRGLYWAYAEAPYGPNDWRTAFGEPLTIPFQHPDVVEIGTPSLTHGTAERPRSTIYPQFTETSGGAMHAIVRVDNLNVHYWKPAGATAFESASGGEIANPNGRMYAYGGHVIMIDRSGDRIIIRSAPEGTNDWTTIHQETTGPEYRHFNGVIDGDKIHLFLMQEGNGDAQPLRYKTYQLSGGTTSTDNLTTALPDFRVFPNPATDVLQLRGLNAPADFRLLDATGRVIRQGKASENGIDVSRVTPGFYYLDVRSEGQRAVRRVVVQ